MSTYHLLSSLVRKESLDNSSATESHRRAEEERGEHAHDNHGTVGLAVGASDVASHTADCGDEPDWTAAEASTQWLPEERRNTENGDLDGCQVGGAGQANVESNSEQLEGRDDTSSDEDSHEGMEGDQHEIDVFL